MEDFVTAYSRRRDVLVMVLTEHVITIMRVVGITNEMKLLHKDKSRYVETEL